MKKILLTLSLVSFILGQAPVFAMDLQKTIVVRITDITGYQPSRYILQVPYYKENKKIYVLFDDIYNGINNHHNIFNAQIFNLVYFPDGKNGFVDYGKGRIFLDLKSLDDIVVVPFDENV